MDPADVPAHSRHEKKKKEKKEKKNEVIEIYFGEQQRISRCLCVRAEERCRKSYVGDPHRPQNTVGTNTHRIWLYTLRRPRRRLSPEVVEERVQSETWDSVIAQGGRLKLSVYTHLSAVLPRVASQSEQSRETATGYIT